MQLFPARKAHTRRRKTNRINAQSAEVLETRTLLSAIKWVNEGDDRFELLGSSAETARDIVRQAISDWETVIEDFNYQKRDNVFELTLYAVPNMSSFASMKIRASEWIDLDPDPKEIDWFIKPYRARVKFNAAADWFLDETPRDDVEFPILTSSRFAAQQNSRQMDFYSTMVHEIGHAVGIEPGITMGKAATIRGSSWIIPFDSPVETGHSGVSIRNVELTRGRERNLHVAGLDVMSQFGTGTRLKISDVDAELLRTVYKYDVRMPSTIQTVNPFVQVSGSTVFVNPRGVRVGLPDDSPFLGGPTLEFDQLDARIVTSRGNHRIKVHGLVKTFNQYDYRLIVVDGGNGADVIDAEHVNAELNINGRGGNDSLIGSRGHDTIDGGAGNDTITGFGGDDWLYGGADDDEIWGGSGRNNLYGDAGADLIIGGDETDVIDGGDGNDTLKGFGGQDFIVGGLGDDVIFGGSGGDFLLGDQGWIIRDAVGIPRRAVPIYTSPNGNPHQDRDGIDLIFGEAGNDTLFSGDGFFNLMLGGSGTDNFYGGIGRDFTDADWREYGVMIETRRR